MKKSIFFGIWVAAFFLMTVTVFAAEPDLESSADKTPVELETSKGYVAEEVKKAGQGTFEAEEFFVSETNPLPVAAVLPSDTTETFAPGVKNGASEAKASDPKVSSAALPEKKAVGIKTAPKTSPVENPAEMQQHWKALFSKEASSDSISYTVKPGDSLYVIARKNHTTVDFIKKINALKSDTIYPKMKLKIHTAPFSMVVDKSKNTLVLYSQDVPVKKYSVATGKKNCTPVGTFKITDKLVNPTWFKTGAILPPGSPKNALGTRWMGFDKPAYGIHGTIEPKTIGTQASEGCIRMLNADVEELYSLIPVGTQVTVQD